MAWSANTVSICDLMLPRQMTTRLLDQRQFLLISVSNPAMRQAADEKGSQVRPASFLRTRRWTSGWPRRWSPGPDAEYGTVVMV
jgi:hypothetical protein